MHRNFLHPGRRPACVSRTSAGHVTTDSGGNVENSSRDTAHHHCCRQPTLVKQAFCSKRVPEAAPVSLAPTCVRFERDKKRKNLIFLIKNGGGGQALSLIQEGSLFRFPSGLLILLTLPASPSYSSIRPPPVLFRGLFIPDLMQLSNGCQRRQSKL